MIQKRFSVVALVCALLLTVGCAKNSFKPSSYYEEDFARGTGDRKTGLGFAAKDKYQLDVFEGNDKPEFNYDEIEKVSIEGEDLNVEQQTSPNGERMLNRGNNYDQKRQMMKQLVAKAQELGATALIKVKYKVFSSTKTTGYVLEGVAVKYRK